MATTRVFKSGNSVAVRIPASFGIAAGTRVTLREEQGRYVFEPAESDAPNNIDLAGIFGAIPDLERLPVDEIDRDWAAVGDA